MATKIEAKNEYVLVLRTCRNDMTSYNGFRWPKRGRVSCRDWDPTPRCRGGLHGLLWGEGSGSLLDFSGIWQVVKVAAKDIVRVTDGGTEKVKFPCGYVVFTGDQKGATDYIIANGASGKAVVGATITAGDRGTATAGDRGTATAGDEGAATAGYGGTATVGNGGTIQIKYWDSKHSRYRIKTGYVGEDGIKPWTKYRLDGEFNFQEVR